MYTHMRTTHTYTHTKTHTKTYTGHHIAAGMDLLYNHIQQHASSIIHDGQHNGQQHNGQQHNGQQHNGQLCPMLITRDLLVLLCAGPTYVTQEVCLVYHCVLYVLYIMVYCISLCIVHMCFSHAATPTPSPHVTTPPFPTGQAHHVMTHLGARCAWWLPLPPWYMPQSNNKPNNKPSSPASESPPAPPKAAYVVHVHVATLAALLLATPARARWAGLCDALAVLLPHLVATEIHWYGGGLVGGLFGMVVVVVWCGGILCMMWEYVHLCMRLCCMGCLWS